MTTEGARLRLGGTAMKIGEVFEHDGHGGVRAKRNVTITGSGTQRATVRKGSRMSAASAVAGVRIDWIADNLDKAVPHAWDVSDEFE
jgi:hypothetical protein